MTAVLSSPREQWLLARRECLGASDVAAVLGVDPRRGPLAVYASKVGDVDADETRWMRWGRLVEGAIAEGYSEQTGRPIADLGAHEIQKHPDVPFLGATLDRVTSPSELNPGPAAINCGQDGLYAVPLECKAVAGFKAKEWAEDPPLHFQVQLQAQLACTGAQWGSLVALIGGLAIAWKDMLRDDELIAGMLPKLEEFWLRVQRRQPPEADGLPGTGAAIKKLWAHEDGETVALDGEALALAEKLDVARAEEKAASRRALDAENKLRARMGSASFGLMLDGSFLGLREVARAGYSVDPTSYRVLRRFSPRIRRRA